METSIKLQKCVTNCSFIHLKTMIVLAYWKLCCVLMLTMRLAVAYDFCYYNCGDHKHILCNARTCEETFCEGNDPDWEWRSNMIFAHNVLRNHLGTGKDTRGNNSAASNMRALSYDLGLEVMAACKLYKFGLGTMLCIGYPAYYFLGQNWYQGSYIDPSTISGMKKVVQQWYEEIVNTTDESVARYPTNRHIRTEFARFSQVVWAETTHVGCARCENDTIFYVLCMYGPSGNLHLYPIYERGSPASKCPQNVTKNTKYGGLCGDEVLPPNATIAGLHMTILDSNLATHAGVSSLLVVMAGTVTFGVSSLTMS